MENVRLKCVTIAGKLRVKIISPGYNQFAFCQFPRDIRRDGCEYSVPIRDVSFSQGPRQKFFYRIKKGNITILNDALPVTSSPTTVNVNHVYDCGDGECSVCMAVNKDVVFAQCGHYCCCSECASVIMGTTGLCPMCRNKIIAIVKRDQIE
jgi:hypothetical protein